MLVLLNYDKNVYLQKVMEALPLLKTLLFTCSRQTGKYSIEIVFHISGK